MRGSKKKANEDLRILAKKRGVYHYEIAEALGINGSSYTRLLQTQVSPQKRQQIIQAIEKIASGDE